MWTSFSARLSIRWKSNKRGMHFRKFCQSAPNISPLLLLVWDAENVENWGSCSCACPYAAGHQSYLGLGCKATDLILLHWCIWILPTGHPVESLPNPRTPATLSLAFFRPPDKGNHLLRPRSLLHGLIHISYNVELGFFFFFPYFDYLLLARGQRYLGIEEISVSKAFHLPCSVEEERTLNETRVLIPEDIENAERQ